MNLYRSRSRSRISRSIFCAGLMLSLRPEIAFPQAAPTDSSPAPVSPLVQELQKQYIHVPAPLTSVPSSLPLYVASGAPVLTPPGEPGPAGPLTPVGRFFSSIGITPRIVFGQFYFTNPDTGPREGRFSLGTATTLGFNADLNRMIGWRGAQIQFEEILFRPTVNEGYPFSKSWLGSVGSFFGGKDAHDDLAGGWLAQMTYQQVLFHDHLMFAVGRTHPQRYFMFNNCDNLLNCDDPVVQGSNGMPPPPYAFWGGYVTARIVDGVAVEAGAFESNINQYAENGNGWRWDTRTASGYLLFAGLNLRRLQISHVYSSRYQIFGFFRGADLTDPYTHTAHYGRAGGEFRMQQMVWRKDHAHPVLQPLPESLHLFGFFAFDADPSAPYVAFAEMGLSYHGLFGRKLDTAQIKFGYTRLSQHEMLYEQRERTLAGGDPRPSSQNVMRLAISGHISLIKGIAVEPSLQYIFNPDNYYYPGARTVSRNGLVLAGEFAADLGYLLGLSHN